MTAEATGAPEVLRGVPLFAGLTERSLAAIADLAEPRSFAAGDVLVREGDEGDAFLVIVNGEAAVTRHGRAVRRLGPGDHLGEIALLDGRPRTATVTAVTAIATLTIGRAGFERLMQEIPVVRLDIVTALADRVRDLTVDPLG